METNRLRKLAGLLTEEEIKEQSEVDIVKAGKVLGQTERLANQQGTRADKAMRKTRPDFLRAVAESLVWSLIESRMDDWTGEDIEEVADQVGMTVEEFGKAQPKTIIKLIIGDTMEEALERIQGDDDVLELLGIDNGDLEAHINGVKF